MPEILCDLLAPDLDLVFVGTAAGHRSAAERAYYAHPGNRFWRELRDIGLTPRLYAPHEFPELLKLGIGFTDMSKVGSGMDHEIAREHFDVTLFETKMRRFRPRAVAFTSKQAKLLGVNAGDPGLFIERRGFLSDGRAAEYTQSFYRGDSYDWIAELNSL